jgi:hypothetical protein
MVNPDSVDPRMGRGIRILGDLGNQEHKIRIGILSFEGLAGPIVSPVNPVELIAQYLSGLH